MTGKATNILKRFKSKKVLVIGELIVDVYVQGTCSRIAPEASVPVIDVQDKKYCLGGAANVAANLAALGADVSFLSACGNDDYAITAHNLLKTAGLKTDHIFKVSERTTLYKTRVSSDSQLLVRFDEGSTHAISTDIEQTMKTALEQLYREADAVFIADYGKGILVDALIAKLEELSAEQPKVMALDTKNYHRYLKLKPTIVKPNCQEASVLIGQGENPRPDLPKWSQLGETLYAKTAAQLVLLTLDAQGVCAFEKGTFKFHKAVPQVQNPKVSGAGDTFLATALMALAANADLETMVSLAIAAAHQVVQQPQTSVCALSDLANQTSEPGKCLESIQAIKALRAELEKKGRKIVFTNGCFDILHSGHVSYLRGAKAQGDVLIVGLNNDESIRRLKGPERPINSLKDRIDVLSELSCIDYIIPFGKAGDDTPISLVQQIRPHVFVKGGDYRDKYLPEERTLKKLGCEIIFLPMVADRSTTNMISKIRENAVFAAPIAVN
ncbi:D-glycero-beta-D-manno-heptose 1-phosphate adenylyltransferase [Pedobacter endophyticus]|uniref:D-glycero-beta-D-manno-heptose 1-phosphate adenylyltransferase n=1 Tax=Pedobacter endophyticus TaxID=2789740 RepID=A0A7S9L2H8_9SPHI|nr:D-glycero-beta-D-manno-heptose 1-phosphate adenylyltransferase [Pedobacter endophyticus]QPH41279.1 D-glycero-beta-D-manno-heptose 1-phosphate adenylyltransferase [Pedobacter endophyticus]